MKKKENNDLGYYIAPGFLYGNDWKVPIYRQNDKFLVKLINSIAM
jgi:hypothetical protein